MKQSLAQKVVADREARERNAELKLEEADAAFRARTNGPIPRTGDAARHGRRPLVLPGATGATIESAAWRQRPDGW